MIKYECAWQHRPFTCCTLQLVAQLGRAKRVEARFHEWRIRIDAATCCALHHFKHLLEANQAHRHGRNRFRSTWSPTCLEKLSERTCRWVVEDQSAR